MFDFHVLLKMLLWIQTFCSLKGTMQGLRVESHLIKLEAARIVFHMKIKCLTLATKENQLRNIHVISIEKLPM